APNRPNELKSNLRGIGFLRLDERAFGSVRLPMRNLEEQATEDVGKWEDLPHQVRCGRMKRRLPEPIASLGQSTLEDLQRRFPDEWVVVGEALVAAAQTRRPEAL